MPFKNPKQKTRNQRQHRHAGHVRRIEVVLSAESERDHAISDYLDDLPHGEMAEFVRQAIMEKIAREGATEPQPAPEPRASEQIELLFEELDHQRRTASEQIETLYQELADEKRHAGKQLEAMIAELAALRQAMHHPIPAEKVSAEPKQPPTLPESQGAVTSSGIDMSRPRPRKSPPKAAPQIITETEELSEQDQIRLAKIMAASIKRAQPGRG